MDNLTSLVILYCSLYSGDKALHCRRDLHKCIDKTDAAHLRIRNDLVNRALAFQRSCVNNRYVIKTEVCAPEVLILINKDHGFTNEDSVKSCANKQHLI